MDSKEGLNNSSREDMQMALRTSGIKDITASRIYYLLFIFSASLHVRGAQIHKESKWWNWGFSVVLLIALLYRIFVIVLKW